MAAGKSYNITFKVSGELDSTFSKAMEAATKQLNALKNVGDINKVLSNPMVQKMGQTLAAMQGWQKSENRLIEQLRPNLTDAQAAMTRANQQAAQALQKQQDSAKKASELHQQYERLNAVFKSSKGNLPNAEVEALSKRLEQMKAAWDKSQEAAKSAGKEYAAALKAARAEAQTAVFTNPKITQLAQRKADTAERVREQKALYDAAAAKVNSAKGTVSAEQLKALKAARDFQKTLLDDAKAAARVASKDHAEALKAARATAKTEIEAAVKANQQVAKLSQQKLAAEQKAAELKRQYDKASLSIKEVKAIAQADAAAMKKRLDEVKAAWKASEAAAKAAGKEYTAALKAADRATKDFQNTWKQIRQESLLRDNALKSLRELGVNTSAIKSQQDLEAAINRTTAALQRQVEVSVRRQNFNAALDEYSSAYNNFQNAISTAQTVMAPFAASVETAAGFEKQMSTVKALTQMDNLREGRMAVVQSEMRELTDLAKHLGLTTQFTATQAAQGETYLAYAGWNKEQIVQAMPHVLNLASAAGMTDLGRAADIQTDIMSAFKIPAGEAQRVADVLTYTFTHSNQNLEQLYETMKYAAPIARLFGSSLEETAAITKFMADAGVKGSMAGTATRSIMTRLVAPPKTASKAMEENGITLADANKEWINANEIAKEYGVTLHEGLTPGKQMASVIRQINENMGGLSAHEKLSAFKAITGLYALSGAANLFETGGEIIDDKEHPGQKITRLESFTRDLENSDGSAEQTAAVMLDNYAGQVTLLKSAFEGLQNEVGSALTPTIRAVVETITPLVTKFAEFNARNPQLVQGIAAVAAGFSSVIVAGAGLKLMSAGWAVVSSGLAIVGDVAKDAGRWIIGLGAKVPAVMKSWGALFSSIAAKARAFGAVLSGLSFAKIGAGIKALGSSLIGLVARFGSLIKAFGMLAVTPAGVALMALAAVGIAVYKNWDKVAPVLSNVASVLGGRLMAAWQSVSPVLQQAGAAFGRVFDALGKSGAGDMLAKGFVVAASVIASALTSVVEIAAHAVAALASLFGGLADIIGNLLAGDFEAVGAAAKKMVVETATQVGEVAKAAVKAIPNAIEAGMDAAALYDKMPQILETQQFFSDRKEQAAKHEQEFLESKGITREEHYAQIQARRAREKGMRENGFATVNRVNGVDVTSYDEAGYDQFVAERASARAEAKAQAEADYQARFAAAQEQLAAQQQAAGVAVHRDENGVVQAYRPQGLTSSTETVNRRHALSDKDIKAIAQAQQNAPQINIPSPEAVKNSALPTEAEIARISQEAYRQAEHWQTTPVPTKAAAQRHQVAQGQLSPAAAKAASVQPPNVPAYSTPLQGAAQIGTPILRLDTPINGVGGKIPEAPPAQVNIPSPESVKNSALPKPEDWARITAEANQAARAHEAAMKVLYPPKPVSALNQPDFAAYARQNPPPQPVQATRQPESPAPTSASTAQPPSYQQWQSAAPQVYAAKYQATLERTSAIQQRQATFLESLRDTFIPPAEKIAPKVEAPAAPSPTPAPIIQPPSYQQVQPPRQFSYDEVIRQANEASRVTREIPPQPAQQREASMGGAFTAALSSVFSPLLTALNLTTSTAAAATPESVSQRIDTSNIQTQLNSLGAAASTNATSLTTNAQNFTTASTSANQSLSAILNSTDAFGQHLASISATSTAANQSISTIASTAENANQSLVAVSENISNVQTATQSTSESLQEVQAPALETANSLEQSASSIQNVNETFSQVTQSISESVLQASQSFSETLSTIGTSISESFTQITTSTAAVNESLALITNSTQQANETFAQATSTMQQVNSEAQQLAANFTANNSIVQQDTASFTANSAAIQQNSAAAQASASALATFTGSVNASIGGVTALGSSSSSAAGSVSALGVAASNAVATMNSAAVSIANAAASAGRPAQNYKGGIYNKGAFLTWFAEKSPEAAIPLDGSNRAINLWQQAGSMLGVYPYENYPASFDAMPELKPAENYRGGIYAPGGRSISTSVNNSPVARAYRFANTDILTNSGAYNFNTTFAQPAYNFTDNHSEAFANFAQGSRNLFNASTSLQEVSGNVLQQSQSSPAAQNFATLTVSTARTSNIARNSENAADSVHSEASTVERKNFLQKGAEAVNNFFYRIFHPRKYADQQRGYSTDKLGNIIGLNGLKDNVITGRETIAVQRAKREAQLAEYREMKERLARGETYEPIVSERAAFKEIPQPSPQAQIGSQQQARVPDWALNPTPTFPVPNANRQTFNSWLEWQFTPSSVKKQWEMQQALEQARRQNLSEDVKNSKTYQTLIGARVDSRSNAMMAPRQWDGLGLIQSIRSGHWNRAADTVKEMYKLRNEIKSRESILNPISTGTTLVPSTNLATSSAAQNAAQNSSFDKSVRSKNFLQKSVEAASNYIYKIIHPRKYAAKELEYETDELGNIKNLGGLPDNVITEDDDKQVRRSKRIAQYYEYKKKRMARTDEESSASITPTNTETPARRQNFVEKIFNSAANMFGFAGKRNAFFDWDFRKDIDTNLGRVVYNMFGGDQTGIHNSPFDILYGGTYQTNTTFNPAASSTSSSAATIFNSSGGIFNPIKHIVAEPGESGGGLKSILENIFTPSSVKRQREMQSALDYSRRIRLSDDVKNSKSYQTLTSARKPSKTPPAMMATRQWDGVGVVQSIRSGHWKRALSALGSMYSNRLEIKDWRNPMGAPHTSTFPVPTQKSAGSNFPIQVTTPPYVNIPSAPKDKTGGLDAPFPVTTPPYVNIPSAPKDKTGGFDVPFPMTTPPYVNAPSSNLPLPPIIHQNDASKNLIQQFTHSAPSNISNGAQLAQLETFNAQNRGDTFNQLETTSRSTASGDLNMPPINLSFNITIQGNANREEVEAGVRQSVPMFRESMDDWWKSHQHELQRRGFDW